jgi:hypothetical protein
MYSVYCLCLGEILSVCDTFSLSSREVITQNQANLWSSIESKTLRFYFTKIAT